MSSGNAYIEGLTKTRKPGRKYSTAGKQQHVNVDFYNYQFTGFPEDWPVQKDETVQWLDRVTGEICEGTVKSARTVNGVKSVSVRMDGGKVKVVAVDNLLIDRYQGGMAYCKYCYETHSDWESGGDYDSTTWICGKCGGAIKDEFLEIEGVEPSREQKQFYNRQMPSMVVQPVSKPSAIITMDDLDALAKADIDFVKITESMRDIALAALDDNLNLEQLVDTKNQAKALQDYISKKIRSRDAKLEAQNNLAEVRIRYERELGALIGKMQAAGELASKNNGGANQRLDTVSDRPLLTLSDVGIEHHQSKRWQNIAALPEDKFEEHIAEAKERGYELTSAGIQRHGLNWRKQNGLDTAPDVDVNPKTNKLEPMMTSDTPEWYTPPDVIERVIKVMGAIDLDPCSNSREHPNVPAKLHYTAFEDGLSAVWEGRVYMNPPYGREIGDWTEKAVAEYKAGNVTQAILLLPARTDTQWFQGLRDYMKCFLFGRLKFSGHDNSAPFPNVVVNIGCDRAAFIQVFGEIGDVYERVTV